MKKLTEINYKDVNRMVESISHKDSGFMSALLNFSRYNNSLYLNIKRDFVEKKMFVSGIMKKFPRIEELQFYSPHPEIHIVTISFNYKNDLNQDLDSVNIVFSDEDHHRIFSKNITRGKLKILDTVKAKYLKESKNYDQRERAKLRRIASKKEEKAQTIYI